MEEIWKDITGYEGLYQASNLGNVRSYKKYLGKKYFPHYRILKGCKDKDGYLKCVLVKNKNKKTYFIHRLVAQTFLENKENLPCVNHKDENKSNNIVSNLEWCTVKYNNYGTAVKRRALKRSFRTAQYDLNNNLINVYCSYAEARRITNISHIDSVCLGKRKTAGGYIWRYID